MFLIDDILAAKAAGKILPMLIGTAIVLGVGAAGAEIYEHKVPWGLGPQRDRLAKAVNDPVNGYIAQVAAWKSNRLGWVDAYGRCEKARSDENNRAGVGVTVDSGLREAAASDGFEQGYAAGKAVGSKQCGAPHATPNPVPTPAGPGGVRDATSDDFADHWRHGADSGTAEVRPKPQG